MTSEDAVSVRYTRVAIALHWLIAIAILFNLVLGFLLEGFPPPKRGIVMPLHMSAGITILALTVLRVAWRLTHRPPPFAAGMRPWERRAAHGVHFLLYAAMMLMPLIGWSILSAHPPPGSAGAVAAAQPGPPPGGGPRIWGVVPLPPIAPIAEIGASANGVARQKALHDGFVAAHAAGAWLLILLLALHLLGALKHQLFDGVAEFARMGLGQGAGRPVSE